MSLIPRWFNQIPGKRRATSGDLFRGFFDDIDANLGAYPGLSVSSDEEFVYVEADVPGLTAKDIDVSIDSDNILWIKGEKKEEARGKKFYKKAQQAFSYCVPLWDEVDETQPEAVCKNGVMKVTFSKKKEKPHTESKKIPVKEK